MVQSTYNPCLMVTNNSGTGPFRVVSLQTNNTLFLGNKEFVELEDKELKTTRLLAKPAQTLTPNNPLVFNRCKLIMGNDRAINMILKDQGKQLKLVSPDLIKAK